MRHAIPRQTHVWTEESDERLLAAVNTYGTEKLVFECVHFPVFGLLI